MLKILRKQFICKHKGENQSFCSKCGKDIRQIVSYECRICSLSMKTKIYPADTVPSFCVECGAPKFTFKKNKKKRLEIK